MQKGGLPPGEEDQEKSWIQRALIGRTPSLPSSLGKRKQSFLKKLQSRKISTPSFALRPNPKGSCPDVHHTDPQDKQHSSFTIGSGHSSSCSSISQSRSVTPDTRRRQPFRQDTTRSHSPATPPIDAQAWFLPSDKVVPSPITFGNLDEAGAFVEELREKYRLQGSQLVVYKKKLRQQKTELSNLRLMQKQQLEEITSQLILFESCLRKKEKQLEEALHMKNQVILKQQRVIKHLIKKDQLTRGRCESTSGITRSSLSGSGSDVTQSEPIVSLRRLSTGTLILHSSSPSVPPGGESSLEGGPFRSDPEYDLQNDSDSAILSEDQTLTEVSLSVPNLLTTTKLNRSADPSNTSSAIYSSSTMTIIADDDYSSSPRKKKEDRGRKTKEERRISNRQKLLSLKRHSGFLKRPEILETVYSVEEDAEKQNENGPPKTEPDSSQEKPEPEKEIPPTNASSTGKSNRAIFLLQHSNFRSRFDSDINISDPELSTDEESNRIVFSETDASASCCTCSRRSSFCYCSSRTGSRRSSYGSHANLILAQGDDEKTVFYNRVMTNHKSVLKPRDIKFKRINKSKSKSLEELRGKLRSQILERASMEKEGETASAQLPMREKGIRGIFKQSLSLDHGGS